MNKQIENPDAICLSVFEDANGEWAKCWEVCTRVRVEFIDGREPVFLTPKEFSAMSPALRAIICAAPSSYPVMVEPTAQTDGIPVPPLRRAR